MSERQTSGGIRWSRLVLIGLIVLAPAILVSLQPKPFAFPKLTLSDGSVVRILGVTYGTNHVLGPPLARVAARLPAVPRAFLTLLGGRWARPIGTTTASPACMVVWLERTTNSPASSSGSPYFEVLLSDASGFISGDAAQLSGWWSPNPQLLRFSAIPRRDPVIALNFFCYPPTGGVRECGKLSLPNPVYGHFPQWTPESLPTTKRVGDVEATLERLSTGHDSARSQRSVDGGGSIIEFGANGLGGRNHTVCLIRLRSLTDTNQVWQVAGEDLSDATGNSIHNTTFGLGGPGDDYFSFEPGLWTNESAWRIKCEIKRVKGFAPEEMISFRNVPLGDLGATNRVGWTTNFNGISITLADISRQRPNTNSSWSSDSCSHVNFAVMGVGTGLQLDLFSARADKGVDLGCVAWSSSSSTRAYSFRAIPPEASTADFTFTLQRSRWVEFTARPEVRTARRVRK